MGRPIGMNLLKAGFPLTVWNRTPARAQELVAAGAHLAASPSELAARSELVISIVSDPPALEEVLWRADGAMQSFQRGSIYMDSSTVLFMVGGDAQTLKAVEPVLRVLGKKWFHLGPHGAGQTIKLAMNLILALQVDALAEALALVTGAGLEGEKLVEVLQSSMARSGVLDVKAPNLLKGEYTPSFPLRLMHKDLRLALELAKEKNVELPAAAAAYKTYSAVKDAAKEDLDYSAVMKFWNRKETTPSS